MGSDGTKPVTPKSVQATNDYGDGRADVGRAIRRERVSDYPERLAYRKGRCQSGDSYSCGAKSALETELASRRKALDVASRLRPGDRAIRQGDGETRQFADYNRGTVVADSKGQCGSYDNIVAFRPDSFVVQGAYECVSPNGLLSGDQLQRSIAAIERIIPRVEVAPK